MTTAVELGSNKEKVSSENWEEIDLICVNIEFMVLEFFFFFLLLVHNVFL